MNKEYTRIGNKVFVRDEKGHLHTRELYKNINEVLLKENRLEVIDGSINEEVNFLEEVERNQEVLNSPRYKKRIKSFMIFCYTLSLVSFPILKTMLPSIDNLFIIISELALPTFTGICIHYNYHKDIRKLNFEKKHIQAVINLYESEKISEQESLRILKKEKLTLDNNLVEIETIPVSDDFNYISDLIDKADIAYDYAEKEQKLLKMNRKGKLDSYLDQIGCREEEKSIYKDLLGINSENKKSKPNQKCK